VEVIRKLVDSYFSIVKKTLLDQVWNGVSMTMIIGSERTLCGQLTLTFFVRFRSPKPSCTSW
jgi:hypothetical protein